MKIDVIVEWLWNIVALITVFVCMALLFSGCASQPQFNTPDQVPVPIPVACIDSMPERPILKSDADLKAMDDYALTVNLLRDRYLTQIYTAKLEAMMSGCM